LRAFEDDCSSQLNLNSESLRKQRGEFLIKTDIYFNIYVVVFILQKNQ